MLGVFMSELPKGFVTAGHAVLFQDTEAHRCDVCGASIDDRRDDTTHTHDTRDTRDASGTHDTDDSSFAVLGRGLLVWSRGEERRYQEPPLCATCAVAIGVTALQRYEIEEEEG